MSPSALVAHLLARARCDPRHWRWDGAHHPPSAMSCRCAIHNGITVCHSDRHRTVISVLTLPAAGTSPFLIRHVAAATMIDRHTDGALSHFCANWVLTTSAFRCASLAIELGDHATGHHEHHPTLRWRWSKCGTCGDDCMAGEDQRRKHCNCCVEHRIRALRGHRSCTATLGA